MRDDELGRKPQRIAAGDDRGGRHCRKRVLEAMTVVACSNGEPRRKPTGAGKERSCAVKREIESRL